MNACRPVGPIVVATRRGSELVVTGIATAGARICNVVEKLVDMEGAPESWYEALGCAEY